MKGLKLIDAGLDGSVVFELYISSDMSNLNGTEFHHCFAEDANVCRRHARRCRCSHLSVLRDRFITIRGLKKEANFNPVFSRHGNYIGVVSCCQTRVLGVSGRGDQDTQYLLSQSSTNWYHC